MPKKQLPRKLAVILHADVAGSTALVQRNETLAHERIRDAFRRLSEDIHRYGGVAHEIRGDALVAEFARASDAVCAALRFQQANTAHNATIGDETVPVVRVGIALGEEVIAHDTITGAGVVLAQRVEQLADPGGVCVTAAIQEALPRRMPFEEESQGERELKGIEKPVRVYRVGLKPGETVPEPEASGSGSSASRKPRVVAAVAAVAVILVGSALLWFEPWAPRKAPGSVERSAYPLPDKPSIAVLPFANISGDPEQEYFADGLTDDLIIDLSKVAGLFVIARNSVFTYKERAVDVREVGRTLGVRYVLEGSVRRADDHVRINAQLVDSATGNQLWADRYDRPYYDIFALQDEVITRIVNALSVQLTDAERRQVSRLPTHSLEAYDYYLRAEQETHGPTTDIDVFRALGLYEKSITIDDEFAHAYAGYARTAAYLWVNSHDAFLAGALARDQVYEMAGRALALDPELPRAHAVLAEVQLVDGEHDTAIASARRAVDLGPSDAEAYTTLAWVLAYAGRSAEAVAAAETALRFDPRPPAATFLAAGLALYLDGRYDRAVEMLERARDLAPGLNESPEFLGMAYAQAGALGKAKAEANALLEYFPSASLRYFRIVYAHHRRSEDLTRRLDGLGKAGIPEWPFGFEVRPDRRIDGTQVQALTNSQIWRGQHENGEQFLLQVTDDGTAAYSSPSSLRTGRLFFRDDMLCYESKDFMLGRPNCGHVYRDGETQFDYVYVNAFSVMRFSLAQ